LPASVRAASSLALFRRDLKTALFTESYGCQDWQCHLRIAIVFALNFVQCPCSSFLWQRHFNLFIFTYLLTYLLYFEQIKMMMMMMIWLPIAETATVVVFDIFLMHSACSPWARGSGHASPPNICTRGSFSSLGCTLVVTYVKVTIQMFEEDADD